MFLNFRNKKLKAKIEIIAPEYGFGDLDIYSCLLMHKAKIFFCTRCPDA